MDAEIMANATRVLNIGQSLPAQSCDSDNRHGKRTDHKPYDRPEVETILIDDRRVRPVRKKTPILRYPATEVNFRLGIAREQPLILSMSCVTCKYKITCDTR